MLPIGSNQSLPSSLTSSNMRARTDLFSAAYDAGEASVTQISAGLVSIPVSGSNHEVTVHFHGTDLDAKLITETLKPLQSITLRPNITPLDSLDMGIEKLQKRYLDGLQKDNEIKDALANYVTPEGMELYDSTSFDLEGKVRDFLELDKKVLLLLGEAGSGKSTFNRYLARSLWEAYTPQANIPIPVFIALSSLNSSNQNRVTTFFESQGFSREQIEELQKKHRFIFILDGYDELEDRHRCFYKDNQLDDWSGAKVIISSRPEYLGSNYQYKFHPPGKRTALQECRLAPFSDETIKRYVEQYKKVHPEWLWHEGQYEETLKHPELKELLGNPFLLKITLSELPELSEKLEADGQRLTRLVIYDQFVKSWFDRSQQRLAAIQLDPKEKEEFKCLESEGFVEHGMGFSKGLALEMYQAGEVVTTYLASAYAPARQTNASVEPDWRKHLLSDVDIKTKLMRLNAPLMSQNKQGVPGKEYRFIHKSLRDYFVARALWEELDVHDKIEFSSWFNRLNIVNDPAVLQFLAERVRQETKLERRLLNVVEQSKGKEGIQFERGAANALTLLVKAGVALSGKGFNGIRVRGANLSYGVFDHTQFQDADLREVIGQGVWLRGANLNGADLEGLELGERPTLKVKNAVRACCYSLDGRWFAVTEGSDIQLYGAEDLEKVHTYSEHEYWVDSVAFSPDGRWLASGSMDNTMKLWNVLGNRYLAHTYVGHTGWVRSVAFSADGQWLASGSADRTIKLWSISGNRSLVHTYVGHRNGVNSVAFLSDGQWLASGGDDNTVKLWSVSGDRILLYTYVRHEEGVYSVAFSADGQWLASGSADRTIKLWSISGDRSLAHTYAGHESDVNSVAFSADGQWLASGSADRTIKLWSISGDRSLAHTYAGHESGVNSVAFSADGRWLASGSNNNTVRLWTVLDANSFVHIRAEYGNKAVSSVAFSADGQWLASGGFDNTVRLWSVSGVCSLVHMYAGHRDRVRSVAFFADGQWLASGSADGAIKLWGISGDRSLAHTYVGHESDVNSVAFSADGRWLASGSYDRTVKLWSILGDRSLSHTYKGHTNKVRSVAFSVDGQWLASGSMDSTVKLWSVLEDHSLVHTYIGHEGIVNSVAFSADGRWLASGSDDSTVKLWYVWGDRTLVRTYVGHEDEVWSVTFSTDGQWLASASWDSTVRTWSVHSGDCLTILRGFVGPVHSVAWQPLSDMAAALLATGGSDKAVRLWRIYHNGNRMDQIILEWASRQEALTVTDALIEKARNLSPQNRALLIQRGAA
ncbi:WD40 repeat-containing protein [Mycoavidus cysteinexigens]|uniref:WD40 repeat-containing protein n=1 Tax=Mycoavidus cysteinexigens TaxID=1553431 RepID=A0A2Z6EW45_9BURK|nr:NACHT domain-containing protein [Mycoavidus cysteinexigens]BBE09683.1 WD40 repeat-containing protein [Mycoavidus cysteinexigens]GAM51577.1 hypothetical protein EBME_0040 [bacterium endosymbiont of Mortierella elongata FMR23-6]GLR01377.1 hypothetical protein GCM10007934_11890 [Mycoavidus cysteinexigens]